MKSTTARRVSAATLGLALLFGSAATAEAAPAYPVAVQQSPGDDTDTPDATADDNGNDGLWGLLGLAGLLGLLGLIPRRRPRDPMEAYPAAQNSGPPMNTYPPAAPRRNPPGAGQ
jgi:hypothetical protein